MAGDVLDHRQDATGHQALAGGAAQERDTLRRRIIGAVADHLMHLGVRHVEHRQAVHIDPQGGQVMRNQTRPQTGDLPAVLHRQLAIGAAGRIAPPVRRAEPLDPSAFLVDQHGRVLAAHALAQGVDQGPGLVRRFDVAPEQDEAPGPGAPEEGGLFRGQDRTRAAEDAGPGGHFTKQLLPAALSLSQKAVASARLEKPVTEVR